MKRGIKRLMGSANGDAVWQLQWALLGVEGDEKEEDAQARSRLPPAPRARGNNIGMPTH